MTTQLLDKKTSPSGTSSWTPSWTKCLVFSLTAHLAACGYLYFNPFILKNSESPFNLTVAEPKPFADLDDLALLDKNHMIEEAFETIVVMPTMPDTPALQNDPPEVIALAPQPESVEPAAIDPLVSSDFYNLIDQNALSKEAILEEMQEISPSPLFHALEEKARATLHLDVDTKLATTQVPLSLPYMEEEYVDAIALEPFDAKLQLEIQEEIPQFTETPLSIESSQESFKSDLSLNEELAAEHKPSLFIPKAPAAPEVARSLDISTPPNALEDYPLPKLSTNAFWNDDFDTSLCFAPDPDGGGYLFSLSLTPRHDLSDHALKQNFYFFIDRSASSHKHRFSVFKRAVTKALASIGPEENFNIVILDKTAHAMHSTPLSGSLKNKRLAESFLDKQETSLMLPSGNVYKTLASFLPSIPDNEEVHTAILLTDGLSSGDVKKKQSLCNRFVESNRGKLSLHAAAVGKDNDVVLLDLLSSQSGGKLLYSDTHASFPRKLAKLILDIKSPIAKEISITARPKNNRSRIELYPAAASLPLLYGKEPYVISGKIDHPANFELFIQGRHKEDWIGIQKSVSFKEAYPLETASIKRLKKMQASLAYDHFLNDGKVSHLNTAKKLLSQSQRDLPLR